MSSRRKPNLDPDQLDRFLSIVTERTDSISKSSDDQNVANAVHRVLNTPLGNHSAFPDLLQDKLRHFTEAFSDKSLIEIVLDSKTEPVILNAISYCAREYSFHVSTQVENAIAITVYHAAAAGLLANHHKEIAELSYENLIESFTDLMKKRWLVPELKQHLDRACKICQQKQNRKETDEKRFSNKESLKLDNLPSQRNFASDNSIASLNILVNGVGDRIGRYKLLRVLGEGGMGVVYLAEQEEPIRRRLALKVIKPGMDSKRVIARFEAERQALALMDHPNIAHVHDAGTTEAGRPYFAMEYVEGLTITEHCDKHQFTIEERLLLFKQICDAVQYAHQKGIIHRDIKPSNILISADGNKAIPKIIDFGVAKAIAQPLTERTLVTEHDQLFGTPEYMSPEQADMAVDDIDTRSDIYSLGVLLYVLLAGVLPFDSTIFREGGIEHIRQVIRGVDPKTPSTRLASLGEQATKVAQYRRTEVGTLARRLHKELEWIPLKAMRKERSERYRSASELIDDIENYLSGAPLLAGPPSSVYRLRKFVQKNRAPVTGIAAVLVVLLCGIVVSIIFAVRQARSRAEAQAVSDFLLSTVFRSMSPWGARGTKTTVRSIWDAASEDLERGKFTGMPLAEEQIRAGLGTGYWSLGVYDPAKSHFESALEICLTHLGPDHPTTLVRMKELGWIYYYQSRYKEAQQLFEKALQGMQQLGDNERWHTMASLATAYYMQGRFQEAEKLSRDALDTLQRSTGKDPHVVFHLVLATGYTMQGRYSKAEELFKKGLEISGRELHITNWFTLELKQNFGELCRLMGRYSEAEKLLNEAFVGRHNVWGPKHPDTLNTMVSIGWLYSSQNQYPDAEVQFRKVLECAQEVLGNAHITTANCMQGLGTVYLSQGQFDKAEPLLDEALSIASQVMGEGNWYTLRVMNTLAKLYEAQDRYQRADSLFNQTLKGRLDKLGVDHPDTLETKNDLAMLYKEQARYEEAERLLLEALEGHRLKLGDTHPHTLESLKNLIDLYETWNKPEKADEWRSKLEQIEDFEDVMSPVMLAQYLTISIISTVDGHIETDLVNMEI